jgi:hypothetical protein
LAILVLFWRESGHGRRTEDGGGDTGRNIQSFAN